MAEKPGCEELEKRVQQLEQAAYEYKRSEKKLLFNSTMHKILMNISSRCINIPLENVDDAINDALEEIGQFVCADRSYIFKYDFKKNIAINTHEWCSSGTKPQIKNLQTSPLEAAPGWVESHQKEDPVIIHDVTALSPSELKEILEQQDIKSLISVPIFAGNKLEGFVGFDSLKKNHIYSEKELELIKFFSQILINLKLRYKTETELHKNKLRYQNIVENSNDAIMLTKPDGTISYLSSACKNVLGYKPEQLVGKKSWIAYHKDIEKVKRALKRVFKGKAGSSFEYRIITKSGDIKWVSHSWSPIYTNFKLQLIISIIRDVTQLKQIEEERIEAQNIAREHEKQALVGQIAGKMAHDFNNILGVIMGNAQLALLDCQDSKIHKTLELIFKQTLRGKNLTKNLVIFAKDQEPKQEFFKISDKINLVMDLLKREMEGVRVVKDDSHDIPELLADPGMIEHALVNVIQNSIHAMSLVEQPELRIQTFCHDNNILLEIKDNGCGIPQEYLDDIYEPSFTLKGNRDVTGSYQSGIRGTGYGMANVKKYIEQHKGKIFVKSTTESGTLVSISLPVIKKELTGKEKTEIQESQIQFEKYILLVEDEQAISDIQYKILSGEPCNHKVDIAHNGEVAIDLFNRNKYDFISLDYVLPGGIDGMDVYNDIRKTDKTIPILFISGNIEFLESIKNLKQNDNHIDHLSKPCQNKDYVNSINKLLKRVSAEQ